MSRATVFSILANGDVKRFDEASNGMAGAPVIWSHLSQMIGLRAYGDEEKLWPQIASPVFSEHHRIAMAFTFDGAWVKRENIPRLSAALRLVFDEANDRRKRSDGHEICPTIPNMADHLDRLHAEEPPLRGACFQMTSVTDNPWRVRDASVCPTCHQEIEEESRPFNFDRDRENAFKAEPGEIFEVVAEALQKQKAKGPDP